MKRAGTSRASWRRVLPYAMLAAELALASGAGPAYAQSAARAETRDAPADTRDAQAETPDAPSSITLPTIHITAPTPLPGTGVPIDHLPSTSATVDAAGIGEHRAATVPELLNLQLPGVAVTETQGNPYQPEVLFRGYTASPLLGAPQGLSVFQDGVRINDPFGDVVSWDLIPQAAVQSITLVSGSNPLFGLNTLGGALSIRTKDGHDDPGASLSYTGGSFGRHVGQFELGQRLARGWHVYTAGTYFDEEGWRDHSPSSVGQLFGRLGRIGARTDISLAMALADTDLIGNGLVPRSFLDRERASIFTRPDNTRHRASLVTLDGEWSLPHDSMASLVAYHRVVEARTLNGDVNDDYGEEGAAPAGVEMPLGVAVNNRTSTDQTAYGGTLQWSGRARDHELVLGAGYDASSSRFAQTAQTGIFDRSRAVVEVGEIELENRLRGDVRSFSAFVGDTWSLRPDLHLTLSMRLHRTRVDLDDRGPSAPALDGTHRFLRLNPAAGLTYRVARNTSIHAGWSQGSRVPTPIELGCADPLRPCTLPNALAADPPLDEVVARTWEGGLRGTIGDRTTWRIGAFQATNHDDLLFVGTTTSAGYFTNFGKTRRRGLEAMASGNVGRFDWQVAYGFVRATFASGACIVSPDNSTRGTSTECSVTAPGGGAGDDLIEIRPGDRLPGVPEHSAKTGVDFHAGDRLLLGAELVAFSGQYVRGNENNRHRPGRFADGDGGEREFRGQGKTRGYAVVNLHARFSIGGGWDLFARVANLLDERYATAGALAENPFDSAGTFQADRDDWRGETFVAPGAPRAIWVGVRLRLPL